MHDIVEAAESTGKTADAPALSDPASCGEDFAHNFREVIRIAAQHCAGCADYHIVHSLKRLSGRTMWDRFHRKPALATLAPMLANLAQQQAGQIDMIAAACADTAILATCAHASWAAGNGLLDRTQFTILDRCHTPLMLCEDYAGRHGIRVSGFAVDLVETDEHFPADVILVHNFLPYVPVDRHKPLLRKWGSWLKPGGRIVFVNPVIGEGELEGGLRRQLQHIDEMKKMVEDGVAPINEPKEAFFARLDRNAELPRPGEHYFADANSLPNLIASAGLKTLSLEEIPGGMRSKMFTLVVAGAGD